MLIIALETFQVKVLGGVRVRFLREVLPKSQNSDSLPRNQILT
jgi:hypothetical protein